MRLLSCSRMSCWVNWNCRDYINGINELWLPDASALIKTAWWAKWTQADKRTGSILWAYRLLMRKTLLPLFSTDMSVECSDYWGSSSEQGCKQKHWGGDGNKTQILETKTIPRAHVCISVLLRFIRFTAHWIYYHSFQISSHLKMSVWLSIVINNQVLLV